MDLFDLRLWTGFTKAGGDPTQPSMVDKIVVDSRRVEGGNTLFVALIGNKEDGHHYVSQAAHNGAKYAIVRKEWHPKEPLHKIILLRVEDPLAALQQIAQSYRKQLAIPIIAIGGSYGKTMVKDFLLAMLSSSCHVGASPESFNSQIGVPLSLLTLTKKHQLGIIEASSSVIGEMDKLIAMIQPDYAILTRVGKKHLATFGCLETAAREAMKLLYAVPRDRWILMPKTPLLAPLMPNLQATPYLWNEDNDVLPHSTSIGGVLSDIIPYQVRFPDGHLFTGTMTAGYTYFTNLVNITSKAAWLLGASSSAISRTLADYSLEPMRTEIWKSSIGTTFINDTYCSDPQSIDLALRHFEQAQPSQRKIFLFGGMRHHFPSYDADLRRIGQALSRSKLDWLNLFGQADFSSLIKELRQTSPDMKVMIHESYEEALELLRHQITPQDLILIKGTKKAPLTTLTEAFNDSHTHNQCLINLAAIKNNLSIIRSKLPSKTRLMVIVKAFGYGTDDVRMAKFLETCGVDIVGVSYVDEGVALKRAGVKQDIFSINAAFYEAAKLVKWDLQVGVSDRKTIEAIAQAADRQHKKIKVHLHINTGMGRFGCRPEEALELGKLIMDSPSLVLEGIMTHFACADNAADDPFTLSQVHCFDHAIKELKSHGIEAPWVHAANSSGALRFKFPQYNMVRIGLAAYGLFASEAVAESLDLQLAISLTSRIVGINICKRGETISYGRTYQVKKEWEKIAVLPIGYFDGLHRNYSSRGHVFIRGHRAPMVGNICMDFMMVDVTDIPDVAIGDTALIFGEDQFGQYLSPEELATSGNSIVHELITCLGPRIPRIFVYEEAFQIR